MVTPLLLHLRAPSRSLAEFLLGSWGLGAPQAVATLVKPLPCGPAVLSFVVVFPSKWCPSFWGAETRPWHTGESLYPRSGPDVQSELHFVIDSTRSWA